MYSSISGNYSVSDRIAAVIFDLDGTLLNSEVMSTQAINQCLSVFGVELNRDMKKHILGVRACDWPSILINELGLAGKIEPTDLSIQYEQNMAPLRSFVEKMPGAEELTKKLHKHGIPMAIATSSSLNSVRSKMKNHGDLFERMSCVITGDDSRVRNGKPSPDIFLAAAESLNVNPSQCLVFEDATSGVTAAIAAGMKVVAVPDSNFDISEFAGCYEILASLDEFATEKWLGIGPSS